MANSRSILLLLAALVLGVSIVVPAEDMLETAYDESESLPFESAPMLSLAVTEIIAHAPTLRTHDSRLCLGRCGRSGAQRPDHNIGSSPHFPDSLIILDHSL